MTKTSPVTGFCFALAAVLTAGAGALAALGPARDAVIAAPAARATTVARRHALSIQSLLSARASRLVIDRPRAGHLSVRRLIVATRCKVCSLDIDAYAVSGAPADSCGAGG